MAEQNKMLKTNGNCYTLTSHDLTERSSTPSALPVLHLRDFFIYIIIIVMLYMYMYTCIYIYMHVSYYVAFSHYK